MAKAAVVSMLKRQSSYQISAMSVHRTTRNRRRWTVYEEKKSLIHAHYMHSRPDFQILRRRGVIGVTMPVPK